MNYFGIRPSRLYGAGNGAVITTSTTVPTGLVKPAGAVGVNLYIVTNPMLVQLCPKISKVLFTANGGTAFTDLTDALIDADPQTTTGTTLNSWTTLALSNCLIVGIDKDAGKGITNDYDGCRGVWFDIANTNGDPATMKVAYSAVEAVITNAQLIEAEGSGRWIATTETDNTAAGGATLATTARTITWSETPGVGAQAAWLPATINGHKAYWLRFDVSAALDATVSLSGILAQSRYWTQNSITMAALIPAGVGPYEFMFNTVNVGGIELLGVTGAGSAYVNWIIP